MYTLKEVSKHLNIKISKLRYIIKSNENDVERNDYEYSLKGLIQKFSILKHTSNKKKYTRHYITSFVLDIDEFKKELSKYQEYKKNTRNTNKINRLWNDSALECYQKKMNCKKCSNCSICKRVIQDRKLTEPPMKSFVKKLINKYGKPQI